MRHDTGAVPRLVLLAVVGLGSAPALVAQEGALPYDLAFDTREFLWSTQLAITSDGNRVAYAVQQPPPDVDRDVRFMPNGSPSSVAGATVLVTDRAAGTTIDVCPGGNCWRPSWSPDDRTLAFYSDRDGPPQLWIHDAAEGRSRKVSPARVKAKLWAGDEAQWAPDGRTVYVPVAPESGPGAWLGTSEEAGESTGRAPTGPTVSVLKAGSEAEDIEAGPNARVNHYMRENNAAVAAIDVGSGAVRILAAAESEPRPSVMRASASGRWVSYLSVFKAQEMTSQQSTIDLALVPASGGTPAVVAEDLPLLSEYHRANYSWHPTDDMLVYLKEGLLWRVDVGPDGPSEPRQLGAELGELAPTLNWFTRDGQAVVVGTKPQDDQSYADIRPTGLAVVPVAGGEAVTFAIGDRWLYQGVLKADARTVWQPDGASTSLLLQERATGEQAVVRFDHENGESTVLWKGLGRLSDLAAGGRHDAIFGIYQDVSTPPDVYRFAEDFGARNRVSEIEPRLDAVAVGTVEVFETTVPLHDGTLGQVRTAVLLPPGAKRGDRLPAIVNIYPGSDLTRQATQFGGGLTATVPSLTFTSRGYAVLLTHLQLGPNREAGNPVQEMVDVLLPQVYRAAELGYIDVERVAVTGQSFGGYGTGSIVSATNIFRAAVAVSGIYDLAGTYGYLDDEGGSFWVGWSEGGQARMGSHPWANLRRYVDNSPYYRADKIFTPLLIVHGDDDTAYHDAMKLFSALRRLERPVEFATYHDQGHVVYQWTRPNAVDAAKRMVAFYRKHLGKAGT